MFSVFDKYPRKFPLLVFSGLGSPTQNKVISRKETTGRISIDAYDNRAKSTVLLYVTVFSLFGPLDFFSDNFILHCIKA